MPVGTTGSASNNNWVGKLSLDWVTYTWTGWQNLLPDLLMMQRAMCSYPRLSAWRGITGRWSGKLEINIEVAGLGVQKYRKWIMKYMNMITYCLPFKDEPMRPLEAAEGGGMEVWPFGPGMAEVTPVVMGS